MTQVPPSSIWRSCCLPSKNTYASWRPRLSPRPNYRAGPQWVHVAMWYIPGLKVAPMSLLLCLCMYYTCTWTHWRDSDLCMPHHDYRKEDPVVKIGRWDITSTLLGRPVFHGLKAKLSSNCRAMHAGGPRMGHSPCLPAKTSKS